MIFTQSQINRTPCNQADTNANWDAVHQFMDGLGQNNIELNGNITLGGAASPPGRAGHPPTGQVPRTRGVTTINGLLNANGLMNAGGGIVIPNGAVVTVNGTVAYQPGSVVTGMPAMSAADYYASKPIGALELYDTTLGALPTGWGAVGTAGDYLRIAATYATSGGSLNTGNSVTSISIASHSPHTHTGSSLTVADHASHTHDTLLGTCFTAVGSGTFASSSGTATSGGPSATLAHTVGGSTGSENIGLTHPVTDAGHTHTILPTFFGIVLMRKNS